MKHTDKISPIIEKSILKPLAHILERHLYEEGNILYQLELQLEYKIPLGAWVGILEILAKNPIKLIKRPIIPNILIGRLIRTEPASSYEFGFFKYNIHINKQILGKYRTDLLLLGENPYKDIEVTHVIQLLPSNKKSIGV